MCVYVVKYINFVCGVCYNNIVCRANYCDIYGIPNTQVHTTSLSLSLSLSPSPSLALCAGICPQGLRGQVLLL